MNNMYEEMYHFLSQFDPKQNWCKYTSSVIDNKCFDVATKCLFIKDWEYPKGSSYYRTSFCTPLGRLFVKQYKKKNNLT